MDNVPIKISETLTWSEAQQILNELAAQASVPYAGFSPPAWKIAEPLIAAMEMTWAADLEQDDQPLAQPNWTPAGVDEDLFIVYKNLIDPNFRGLTESPAGWVEVDGYLLYRIRRDHYWMDDQLVDLDTAAIAMAGLTAEESLEHKADPLAFFSSTDWQGQLPRQAMAV